MRYAVSQKHDAEFFLTSFCSTRADAAGSHFLFSRMRSPSLATEAYFSWQILPATILSIRAGILAFRVCKTSKYAKGDENNK